MCKLFATIFVLNKIPVQTSNFKASTADLPINHDNIQILIYSISCVNIMRFNILLKHVIGKALPDSFTFRYFSRLPQFNTWLNTHVKNHDCPSFTVREDLYRHIYNNFLSRKQLTYFEMGVWYGAAIKTWTGLDENESSRYFGFDTFKGLPEVWEGLTANAEVGTFDVGGGIENVHIDDSRVALIEGLFQDTVPGFLKNENFDSTGVKILHIDSDLYSSALYCLTKFDHLMNAGDIIIFDELSSMDEFWALQDYEVSFRRSYKVLGHAGDYYQSVAIQLL